MVVFSQNGVLIMAKGFWVFMGFHGVIFQALSQVEYFSML